MVQKNRYNNQAGVCVPPADWSTHQLGLDEVTHYLVVEVINGTPLDPFLDVLFLHGLRRPTLTSCSQRRAMMSHKVISYYGWRGGFG